MGLGWSIHGQQREVADVLQRHVDVLADLGVGGDLVDELVVEVGWVGVEDPDPSQTLDVGQGAQEVGQVLAIPPVHAPAAVKRIKRIIYLFVHAPFSVFDNLKCHFESVLCNVFSLEELGRAAY